VIFPGRACVCCCCLVCVCCVLQKKQSNIQDRMGLLQVRGPGGGGLKGGGVGGVQ